MIVFTNVKYGTKLPASALQEVVDNLPGMVSVSTSFNGVKVDASEVVVEALPYGALVKNSPDLEVHIVTFESERFVKNAPATAASLRTSLKEMLPGIGLVVTAAPILRGISVT